MDGKTAIAILQLSAARHAEGTETAKALEHAIQAIEQSMLHSALVTAARNTVEVLAASKYLAHRKRADELTKVLDALEAK